VENIRWEKAKEGFFGSISTIEGALHGFTHWAFFRSGREEELND
jgi:hypothetical protein